MIIGILVILVFFFSFAYMRKENFLKYIIIGTILRISVIAIYLSGVKIPESQGDAKNFLYEGLVYFRYLFYSGDHIKTINPYSNLIGLTMVYSGENVGFALFLNTLCYIMISATIYEIIKLITSNNKKVALRAVIIITFFPMDILYSAVLLREQFIILFLVLSFWFLIRFIKNGIFFEFLISVGLHLMAMIFHSGILFLLIVHLYTLLFFKKKKRQSRLKWKKVLKFGVLGIILFKILGHFKKFAFLTKMFDINYLNHILIGRFLVGTGAGRTVYLTSFIPSNIFIFAIYLPIRMIYFLFSPFPWMMGNVSDVIVFVDGFIYLILVVRAVRRLEFLEEKIRKTILLYFIAFTLVFSIGTTNYGTAMRHRHKILWLIAIVAVLPKYKNIRILEAEKEITQ